MKKRLVLLFGIVIVVLLLLDGIPALASRPGEPPSPEAVKIGEEDNGGAVEIGPNQILLINLESNPSTGYGWYPQQGELSILQSAGPAEWIPQSGLLGAPGTQVIRYTGAAVGETELVLTYRRPWETDDDVAPLRIFRLHVKVTEPATNDVALLSNRPADPEVSYNPRNITALPSSFNWCDQGACTPVRDQGSCGSCWAFGTVGPLESNILIQDGISRDLSEQYLVSCNTDGYGCDGGWWAHDYHEWKIPSGEPDAGAVYEADFPYVAYDAPCNPPHTHHEKIASWDYVGSSSGVPSTDAIKNAIYTSGRWRRPCV